jgi:Cys-rich protein (TIGR01571 family)
VAGGQVIRRLNFNWCGRPAVNVAQSARAFKLLLWITIFHWVMFGILYVTVMALDPNVKADGQVIDTENYIEPTGFEAFVIFWYNIFKYPYFLLTIIVLWNLRVALRDKYGIPGSEGEDFVCACCCPCLIAGQMLRHTTDYDVYPSRVCSETGLPDTAPSIV